MPTQAAREGRLREMFGCGTACIVQPVDGLVRSNGQVIAAPWDAADPHSLTARLTRALTDIQYGRWGLLFCAFHIILAPQEKTPRTPARSRSA